MTLVSPLIHTSSSLLAAQRPSLTSSWQSAAETTSSMLIAPPSPSPHSGLPPFTELVPPNYFNYQLMPVPAQ
ncbi:hypothetical protein BCV69DRAFT_284212 [Microstroma glucosiphilum]|uniref:Uncharacterized protein n=1 Tax=Pseudomicrostroma glucosiphilum TaxID=1684307 RepID=A0A316U2L1_9BASI|nr:hypothetical protein BCV69DRAFT_284212 [Pseudomicrostroma glucosiphilum]PWN19579.1 hypothetical protein BCV69DRAFT_284212 [Pseudomicrostroma glucosiphilum]